jgi:hypothetical protein
LNHKKCQLSGGGAPVPEGAGIIFESMGVCSTWSVVALGVIEDEHLMDRKTQFVDK